MPAAALDWGGVVKMLQIIDTSLEDDDLEHCIVALQPLELTSDLGLAAQRRVYHDSPLTQGLLNFIKGETNAKPDPLSGAISFSNQLYFRQEAPRELCIAILPNHKLRQLLAVLKLCGFTKREIELYVRKTVDEALSGRGLEHIIDCCFNNQQWVKPRRRQDINKSPKSTRGSSKDRSLYSTNLLFLMSFTAQQ